MKHRKRTKKSKLSKSELGKAKLAKEKFKLAATNVRKECAGLREENAITARALEQKTRGLARKSMAGTNFAELYGVAIVNSSCEGKKETSREHIAWF